ncbi:four-carbon acid sugar kinase family protein [Starkeya koreensis]|uniref:3-oxo-tetronate kinase n=1 Tax=Ancylobacter koreensis TaxID=266121 RepID=A0ABT0DJG6_9HYPH|nr:3-oxo-tetronate kinase [Ancylobacter koreensis]MCK0207420.1 four-carbon acid sugar kinase family protein [Ancylobacter koreensis]
MIIGVIADDFTGASDIANTIAKGVEPEGGLRTVQYLNVPPHPAAPDVEAGVIALKSRSIPAGEAVAQSLAALDWLLAQGCRQIVFKYCSTFDSTPEGNIGPVAEALARRLGVLGVVACPAFPDAGRSVYMGHLFVGDRLLNDSGMEHHPLNPMTDPDLRRWLTRQSTDPVGLVGWPVIRQGAGATRDALAEAAGRGERLVIADAISNDDLLVLAQACAEARLITGGSGIARGLPRNLIRAGLARGGRPAVDGVDGAEAVLVGSCSRATRAQIERHRAGHPVLAVDVDAVMEGRLGPADIVAFVDAHRGAGPLVYSSSDPDRVAALQETYGREPVAHALDALFGEAARVLVAAGTRRIVVGGGETSGAVVTALGVTSFRIGPEIDPGVPVLVAEDGSGLGVALKSGNFGGEDFFARALDALAGAGRVAA